MNPMKKIRVAKVTLNIGVGEPGDKLEKAFSLLKKLTGKKPVKTKTNKRLPEFHLRPGLEIGCKVTLRGKGAVELLKKLLSAVDDKLKGSQFDNHGNVSFGIKEYIYIPDVRYDPKIGIIGLDVCVTLERPGYRIKRRTYHRSKMSNLHQIKKEEAIEFFKKEFGVEIE